MKKGVYFGFFLLIFSIQAQESNIFLDRSFWKENPSIEIIEQKITKGNDISELNNNAFDGVTYAILEKVDNKTIKHLLTKEGNEVNKLTHDARTYIFWAAYTNNLEMMKYLLANGAKTDIVDSHGYSVLNFTANSGQTNSELYNFLFDSMNANLNNEKNHSGANALLLVAPYLEDFTLVDFFISKGANLKDKDSYGNGLFEYAAKGGNINFLTKLLTKGVEKGKSAMVFASQGLRKKKHTLKTYQSLENLGVTVNAVNEKGRNPLHAIAYHTKDIAVFKYFLGKGVDVNLQDNGGDSPFMNAANSNDLAVVKLLFPYVKNINAKDENGRSALAMAVNRNDVDVVDFLLKKGADINTKDKKGNTLSYYLLNNFKAENPKRFENKLKLLQENGLQFNANQQDNNTLLHIAVQRNNLALLKRLSSFAIDVNAKNDEGFTALQLAAMQSKDIQIIKHLLYMGADKSVTTDFDESVYDLAVENELLQKSKASLLFLK